MGIPARIIRRLREEVRLLRERGWRAAIYRFWLFVKRVDVSFVSVEDMGLQKDRVHWHSTSGGPGLAGVVKKLGVKPGDCILDVGSGKGGALITLSRFPFSRVAGVELCESLVHIAEANLRKLRIRNVELNCCDAVSYPGYDDFNYIYMYNPFPAPVVRSFLRSISESLHRHPRQLTIVYCNPACHDVILEDGMFEAVADHHDSATSQIVRIYSNSGCVGT